MPPEVRRLERPEKGNTRLRRLEADPTPDEERPFEDVLGRLRRRPLFRDGIGRIDVPPPWRHAAAAAWPASPGRARCALTGRGLPP